MGRLRRFIGRDFADQTILLKALFLVMVVRLGLWVFPFRVLRRILDKLSAGSSSPGSGALEFTEKAAWAVTAASRWVPGATKCLVHSLAVQVLLKRRGIPADLRIGVVKDDEKGLQAHAWVESVGRVVIGESGMERYTRLESSGRGAPTPPAAAPDDSAESAADDPSRTLSRDTHKLSVEGKDD